MRNRKWHRIAALIVIGMFAVGCGSRDSVVESEQSVRPGVNKRFKGDLNVDEWVARFESESREVYHNRSAIIDAMHLEPGMDVADIGAGTGFYSLAFADHVRPGGHVYAVDIAKPFLDHIEAEAKRRHLDDVTTIQCPDNSTGLDRGCIDAAFICDTYHHFEFPESTMMSLHRALRKGGHVYIVEFIRHDAGGGRDDAKWMALPEKRREWIAGHVRCDRQTVIDECRRAGFELADEQPKAVNELLHENQMMVFVKR